MLTEDYEIRDFLGGNVQGYRKEVLRMMIGVIVILIFSGLLALIIYLYQDHVDHLNHTIKMLRINKDILGEELDNYKELVEDLDGYYDKWIETVNELSKVEQERYELKQENRKLRLDLMPYQKQTWKQIEESLAEGEMKYI